MAARDYDAAPASDRLSLDKIIAGLASDLDELRAGRISTNDAIARSMLAKQLFNGVRLYLSASKLLSEGAKQISDNSAEEIIP